MKARIGLAAFTVLASLWAVGDPATAGSTDDMLIGHDAHTMPERSIKPADRVAATLATAAFQDVERAEAAGYASTIDTLGCFQNPGTGGMGLHYLNNALMDATVDMKKPEALVYELDSHGKIAGLVAHEYIVPFDAWKSTKPPHLFGVDFHRHSSLPLWVLHAWLWKDNQTGVFQDWNPAVRLCPAGVPIFGSPAPTPRPADPNADIRRSGLY